MSGHKMIDVPGEQTGVANIGQPAQLHGQALQPDAQAAMGRQAAAVYADIAFKLSRVQSAGLHLGHLRVIIMNALAAGRDLNAAEQQVERQRFFRIIGIIHCVGSRDEKVCNYHCSKLCCITGVKQAIELRELLPDTEIFCFYMDMRMFGPGYEEMYRDAQEKYNIKFVRGRLSEAAENMNKQLQIKVEDTLVGKPLRMTLDMMILLVGMESSEGSRQMADTLGLNLAPNGFIKSQDPHYRNNNTNVEGVFVAGCGSAPMNLTDTLADARSAAMNIIEYVKLKKIL